MVFPHLFRTEHGETKTTSFAYGEYFIKTRQTKIKITPRLLKILNYIDSNRRNIIKVLEEAVAIKSVSGLLEYRNELKRMVKFTEDKFKKLGIKYECFNIGRHIIGGEEHNLPVIILASLGNDLTKKTVCVYSYLDVNLPNMEEWRTDPWTLTTENWRLYGNGVAGGKATTMMWLAVIEAFQEKGVEIPVNLKFIIEGSYNTGSQKFEEFVDLRKQHFFAGVDYYCVVDSEWIGEKHPCLVYGSVGRLRFELTVEKAGEKSTTEPKDDAIAIFEKIVDDKEKILIPHFYDAVKQTSPDEEQMYEAIQDFDVSEVRDKLPEFKRKWDKVKLLMSFWRMPSIEVGDVEECTCEKNDKTKVKRKFTIKIVPKQVIEPSIDSVIKYVNKMVKELKILNKVQCELVSADRHWLEDIRSINYEAALRATIQIYKEEPSYIREDRPIHIVNTLSRTLDGNVLVLPIGDCMINTGGSNESLREKNYYEGIKLMGAYLIQLAELS